MTLKTPCPLAPSFPCAIKKAIMGLKKGRPLEGCAKSPAKPDYR
jgi:hypothetical protein